MKTVLICIMMMVGLAGIAAATMNGQGSLGSGFQSSSSVHYSMEGGLGGIVGGMSNASGSMTASSGSRVALVEMTQLVVSLAPAMVNEGESNQAAGIIGFDDGSVSVLAGSNILWQAFAYPVVAVSSSGVASAGAVWSNMLGRVSGSYRGIVGGGDVLVMDSDPDNYGIYGTDGIPDGWQVRWFGTSNPLGVATATNSFGQDNRYAYIADLDPTNPASVFKIVGLSNGVSESLVFFPSSANRRYVLESTTNLHGGDWASLLGTTPEMGNGGIFALRNTHKSTPCFYRVQVCAP
jgi:hypothetical protein